VAIVQKVAFYGKGNRGDLPGDSYENGDLSFFRISYGIYGPWVAVAKDLLDPVEEESPVGVGPGA